MDVNDVGNGPEGAGGIRGGPPSPALWQTFWRPDVHRVHGHATLRDLCTLLLGSRCFRPIFTARLCQCFPGTGPLTRLRHRIFRRLHRWATTSAGMDFPWEATIGQGLTIVHGWGLVVSPAARIGTNVTIFHGVTLGRKDDIDDDGTRVVGGAPTIGDGVWIGPNVIIVGAVEIGAGSRIGGGSVVTQSVPPRSLVVGNPGRVVRHEVPADTPNPFIAG